MKNALKQDILEDTMEALLQLERDGDDRFDAYALKCLMLRLMGLLSIKVDGDKFMRRAQMPSLMSSSIYDDDLPEWERIITVAGKRSVSLRFRRNRKIAVWGARQGQPKIIRCEVPRAYKL